MGVLMGFFSAVVQGIAKGFSDALNGKKSGKKRGGRGGSMGSGGYGSWTWHNIMEAHCDPDDLIDEFGLDMEGCEYDIPYYGQNAWDQALQELSEHFEAMAEMLGCDVEDLIDESQIADLAYDLAYEYVELLFTGDYWVDSDFLDWGYYDVSDHNA